MASYTLLPCRSREKGYIRRIGTRHVDTSRRIDRYSRDHACHLTKLACFQYALYKQKEIPDKTREVGDAYSNGDIECHATESHWQSSDVGTGRKSCFQERNVRSTGYKLLKEHNIHIQELTKTIEDTERANNEKTDVIFHLRNHLKKKDNVLAEKDSRIKTLKSEVETGLSRISNLECSNKDLKTELKVKDEKIWELTNKSKLRWNTYTDSEITRKEQNSLDELKLEISEYKSNIEHLERRNKETENQLLNEKKKYRDCLAEQQKLKKDFEEKLSSLQSVKYDLEKNAISNNAKIKNLEDELKAYRAISSGRNYERLKNIEGKGTGVESNDEQSNEDKAQARNESGHTKIVTSLRSECQETSQKVSNLETKLKEALQKLSYKEEELRVLETSYQNKIASLKTDFTRLQTEFKSQQKFITSDEVSCKKLAEVNKDLHKKIEDIEKQVRLQREKYQNDLHLMQKRENELVATIDMQKIEILRLEDELHRSKNALSHLEKSMQSKTLEKNTNEVKADADQRKKIAELTKQLQEARTKLHDTETELAETKSRLSKVMGNRLTDNNPNITDLSDRNRPTKLAEKYAELYDNQWTDAFDVLEKSYQREEYVIETLLHILQDVFTFCLKKAKAQMKNLGQELKFADREDKVDVTVDVRKLLKECRKAVGFTENLPKMYQSYLEQSTNDRTKTALKVRAFTAECLEMCWFMVIQDPPVAFAPLLSKGSSFDTDFYKPYTISGAKVDFVVWPPLLLHEGGPILAKGVAQGCGKKTAS